MGNLLNMFGAVMGSVAIWLPSDHASTKHWYQANKETAYADGEFVPSATDFILAEHAVQATEANQPTYQTNELNGHAVFRFDGEDRLVSAAFASEMAQPTTLYSIVKNTGDTSAHRFFCDGIVLGKNQGIYQRITSGYLTISAGIALTSTDATTNQFVLLTGVFNGASSEMFRDGSSIKTGNAGIAGPLSGITLGAYFNDAFGYNLIGDLASIIVCEGVHDAATRTLFWDYLNSIFAVY